MSLGPAQHRAGRANALHPVSALTLHTPSTRSVGYQRDYSIYSWYIGQVYSCVRTYIVYYMSVVYCMNAKGERASDVAAAAPGPAYTEYIPARHIVHSVYTYCIVHIFLLYST